LNPANGLIEKSVFTVVTNSQKYLNFAFALARSYRYHNSLEIPFFIISDDNFELPPDLKWVQKKIIPKELMGKGLEVRFSFAEVSPSVRSLYIDADSLVYRDISNLFELPVDSINVIGQKITKGSWDDMDIPKVMADFKLPYLIRYCGAFYFVGNNDKSRAICENVKKLTKSDYPFQQHTYSINDEPVFSISMASKGVQPIADTGNIWGDVHQLKSHRDLDVLRGITKFNNSKRNPNYKFWIPEGDYSPAIIHFGGGNYNKNPWLFDAARLKLYYKIGGGKRIANFLANLFVKSPYLMLKQITRVFKR
jgi:hypothetical protein